MAIVSIAPIPPRKKSKRRDVVSSSLAAHYAPYFIIPMELHQIETYLNSPNPQNRMKAIAELRHYEPHLVVPLLKQRIEDREFVIRSFVAIGLGYKQTEEAFDLLVDLIESDRDYNVRAEAANSLAKYGDRAIPHLVKLFKKRFQLVGTAEHFCSDGRHQPSRDTAKILSVGTRRRQSHCSAIGDRQFSLNPRSLSLTLRV